MENVIENLPVELVGANVLGYLSLKDIVNLERACGSKKSHQCFLFLIPYYPAVVPPTPKTFNISALVWFADRRCKISYREIWLPDENPSLKNLHVDHYDLLIRNNATLKVFKTLQTTKMGYKVRSIRFFGEQNTDVIKQLSTFTRNMKQLFLQYQDNSNVWLTIDILKMWKLTDIELDGAAISTSLVSLVVQTCSELTNLKLSAHSIDVSAVKAIVQYCPKLKTLDLASRGLQWSLLSILSQQGLPLECLSISYIPNIPNAEAALNCSYALSCIRTLDTEYLHSRGQNVNILIPYMIGLTTLALDKRSHSYIPQFTKYCNKLTKLFFSCKVCVTDLLALCRVNPLLNEFCFICLYGLTDATLIEFVRACPHLHTLHLLYETDITDIGILALSEHCLQLQELNISCHITEVTVLQLLQRCRKLTRLVVSRNSLSKETWAQLDRNTQKRVIRR